MDSAPNTVTAVHRYPVKKFVVSQPTQPHLRDFDEKTKEVLSDHPLFDDDMDASASNPDYELETTATEMTSMSDDSTESRNAKIPTQSDDDAKFAPRRKGAALPRSSTRQNKKLKQKKKQKAHKSRNPKNTRQVSKWLTNKTKQLKSEAHGRGRQSTRKQHSHMGRNQRPPSKTSLAVSEWSKMTVAKWLRTNWQQCDSHKRLVYLAKIKRERKFDGKNLVKLDARQLEVLARRSLGLEKGEADYESFLHTMHKLLTLRGQRDTQQAFAAIRPLNTKRSEQVHPSDNDFSNGDKAALDVYSKSSKEADAEQPNQKAAHPAMHTVVPTVVSTDWRPVSKHKKNVSLDLDDQYLAECSPAHGHRMDTVCVNPFNLSPTRHNQMFPTEPSAADNTSHDRLSPLAESPFEDEEKKETAVRTIVTPMKIKKPTKKLAIGDQIGRYYKIEGDLGEGAYGHVYKAKHMGTSKVYAIKVINARSDRAMAEVEQEARLMSSLHHENIVGFIETAIDKPRGFFCIVLEFACGNDLRELTDIKMSNNMTWTETEIRPILKQILDGLVHLHLQDIIHRDIKGANIMYSEDGVVKLVHFGISAQQSESKNDDEEFINGVGSPCWMAPESIEKWQDETVPVTTKSDIWAVGATAIELFTGRPPYYQHTLEQEDKWSMIYNLMDHILNEQPTIPTHASPQFQDFLNKCFIREASSRPSALELSAHEFIRTAALSH